MNIKWTLDSVPDLTNKAIIVTGGNSGLGYESVKAFAAKGANVILACRDADKGEAAKKTILETQPSSRIELMTLDLANLASIHEFSDAFKQQNERLDILLNNAGVMMTPHLKTKDGFELQLGTNHLGHFALTGLLLEILKKTPGSRVVNISSNGHKRGKMDFDDLMYEKGGYSSIAAYGRSKLANLLFTYELQRRFENAGLDCIAVAAHPGGSNTNLGRYIRKRIIVRILWPLAKGIMQDAAMGALPGIRAAVDPGVKGGEYYGPGGRMEMKGYPVKVTSNEASHDLADAEKLWDISEKLTSVKYEF
ncbi:MAG TPA: oxidoreductase [Candidatus Lokiarchaeia archaeon]|nr:oxidoreductase [Candidatus Lokiarchaeia archaeon]